MIIQKILASYVILIAGLASPLQAETLVLAGTGTDLGTFRLLANSFSENQPHVKISVLPSMGSSGGIKALKHQKIDIALTSRPLKASELSADIRVVHYANTPLVLAVSSQSQHTSTTREQVNKIYSGKLKQWPDGSPARPILRPSQDSDTRIMISTLSLCKKCFDRAYKRRGVPVALTDQESADMIARVPGAIGTSALSLILSEKRPIKPLVLDGIAPTVENISNKSYPMYKKLYLAYNKNHKQEIINRLIEYLNSEKGQAILLDTGHLTIQ